MTNTFHDKETHFQGAFNPRIFRTVALAYRPFATKLVAVLICGLMARGSLLFIPIIIGYWVDSLCHDQSGCHVPPLFFRTLSHADFVCTLITVTLLGFVTNTLFRVGISRLGTRAASQLYDEVTFRTSRFPLSFFDKTPLGRIITRFSSDYAAVFRMAGGPMGELVCILFDLLFAMLFISVASVYFVPLVLVSVFLNLTLWNLNKKSLRAARRASSASRGPSIAHFNETILGANSVRIFGKTESFERQMTSQMHGFLKQRASTFMRVQWFSGQMSFSTALMLLITGLLGSYVVESHLVSVASVAVAFTFVMLTSSTVQQLFEYLAVLEEALTGVERLDEYLTRDLEPGAELPSCATFPKEHSLDLHISPSLKSGFLSLENLSMGYSSHRLVLNNVSFQLNEGESLGVIGKTGSGKSSLLQALLLLYPWQSGCLTLSGRSIDSSLKGSLSLGECRALISYLPQEPVLFKGSLLQNLRPDASEVSVEQITIALEQVGLHSLLLGSKLEKSVKEFLQKQSVDERGARFSQGEKQLICLARCLLQDRPFLFMDEATSHIDSATEYALGRALESSLKNKTKIIVAHRLSTVEKCDRLLWLDNGAVKALGPTSEVLREFQRNTRDI
jgi:ATP-binding cassette, subfamily B, multidrug efflux pump